MKRAMITNKIDGRTWGPIEKPDQELNAWIAELEAKALKGKGWGWGPRKVEKKPAGQEDYPVSLVLSEDPPDQEGRIFVNLDKEYDIVIEDITAEVDARKAAEQSRKNDIQSVKAMEAQIDNSQKPAWEKQLLKRLIRELKE